MSFSPLQHLWSNARQHSSDRSGRQRLRLGHQGSIRCHARTNGCRSRNQWWGVLATRSCRYRDANSGGGLAHSCPEHELVETSRRKNSSLRSTSNCSTLRTESGRRSKFPETTGAMRCIVVSTSLRTNRSKLLPHR